MVSCCYLEGGLDFSTLKQRLCTVEGHLVKRANAVSSESAKEEIGERRKLCSGKKERKKGSRQLPYTHGRKDLKEENRDCLGQKKRKAGLIRNELSLEAL